MPSFGELVKKRREELNLTQGQLAKKCGYNSSTSISRIENGSRDVPQKQVARIAEALGLDPASLITPQVDVERVVIGDGITVEIKRTQSDEEEAGLLKRLLSYYKLLSNASQKAVCDQAEYMTWKERGGNNGSV